MLLSNLLPGLRELRAPLAAGYIWLAVAALWWHDDIPSRRSATGVWEALYDIGDALGPAALPVAASFLAYMIGSLSADFVSVITRESTARGQAPVSQRGARSLLTYVKGLFAQILEAEADLGQGIRGIVAGPREWEELPARVRQRIGEYAALDERTPDPDPDEPPAEEPQRTIFRVDPRRPPDWIADGVSISQADGSSVPAHAVLPALIESEFDLVTTRLIGSESELHSAVDRLNSEGELRLALSLPLMALVISVVLTGASPWWLFALLVPALIGAQATLRYQQAGDILVQALNVGRVEAPVVERFMRRAGVELPQPERRNVEPAAATETDPGL